MLDSRFIGFWARTDEPDNSTHEYTPSGKLLIHNLFRRYEINAEGTAMTYFPLAGPETFQRVGDPSPTLPGTWVQDHGPGHGVETWIMNEDGTYIGNWDDGEWFSGFYDYTDTEFQIAEFRGNISTRNDRYTSRIYNNDFELRYEFEGNDIFRLYNLGDGAMVGAFSRTAGLRSPD